MKPGRKPTPISLKTLRGNPGRRPLNHREPRPAVGVPDPPGWLSPAAREAWQDVVAVFGPLRVLTQADRVLLELVTVTYVRWRDAEATIDCEGSVFETSTGYKTPHPAVAIAAKARLALRQLLAEIGGTPSSRPSLQAAVATPPADDDPFAKYEGPLNRLQAQRQKLE